MIISTEIGGKDVDGFNFLWNAYQKANEEKGKAVNSSEVS